LFGYRGDRLLKVYSGPKLNIYLISSASSARLRNLRRSLTLDGVKALHFYCPPTQHTTSYLPVDLPRLTDIHVHTNTNQTWVGAAAQASTFLTGLSPIRLFLADHSFSLLTAIHQYPLESINPFIRVWFDLRAVICVETFLAGSFLSPPFHPDLVFVQDLGYTNLITAHDLYPDLDFGGFLRRLDAATGFYHQAGVRLGSIIVLAGYEDEEREIKELLVKRLPKQHHRAKIAVRMREEWYEEVGAIDSLRREKPDEMRDGPFPASYTGIY
jgi:hypothetical protein